MTRRHTHLYLYEGCAEHGCKIGIATERSLDGRLIGCRLRCRAAKQFAQVWEIANAFDVEQWVISLLASSGRTASPGEEWFRVPREEMIDAVGHIREVLARDYAQPRRYRTVCGHVWKHAEA